MSHSITFANILFNLSIKLCMIHVCVTISIYLTEIWYQEMISVTLFIVKLLLIKIRYGKCGIVLILRHPNVADCDESMYTILVFTSFGNVQMRSSTISPMIVWKTSSLYLLCMNLIFLFFRRGC